MVISKIIHDKLQNKKMDIKEILELKKSSIIVYQTLKDNSKRRQTQISLTDISILTNKSRLTCHRALKELCQKGIIETHRGIPNTYRILK